MRVVSSICNANLPTMIFVVRRCRVHYLFLTLVLNIAMPSISHTQGDWARIAQPTSRSLHKLSFLDSLRGWACGDGGVIIKTTNGSAQWTLLNTGTENDVRDIFMLDASRGWAITWASYQDTMTFYGTTVMATSNGGSSWSNNDFPIKGLYLHSILFLDSVTGWIGGESGALLRTTDGGITWTQAVVDSSIYMHYPVLNITFYSRQVGFAMGGIRDILGVLWRTTNGGERWTAENISPEPIYELHFVDSLNIIGIVGDFDFGASMVRSSDGGVSWQYNYLGIFGQPQTIDFRTPSEGWVPLDNKLMFTTDTANTWLVQSTPGGVRIFDLVFIDSTTGYAVGDSGYVFKYSKNATEVSDLGAFLPNAFQLRQNYPDPFNPTTTIRFTVPLESFVSIKIFDLLGKEIATLAHDLLQAGDHTIVWNAVDRPGQAISSGIYFYRMEATPLNGSAGFTSSKKMIFLK